MMDDLAQLRDIHLPPAVSWWPPAPGWWGLAALLLALLAAGWWWRRWHQRQRWRRSAMQELAQLRQLAASQPQAALRQLSTLLRRVALTRFPRVDVAALHSDAWLAFLDGAMKKPSAGSFQRDGRLLASGPYAAAPDTASLPALLDLSERWIKQLRGMPGNSS